VDSDVNGTPKDFFLQASLAYAVAKLIICEQGLFDCPQ